MRTKLVLVVVILLLSGSGDCRPQKTESSQPQTTKTNAEEWKSAQPSSTPKTIREDSRYTWNSGNSRIPYINRYRENIDLFTNAKVSVNEPKKMKATVTRRSDADKSRNSPIFANNRDSPDSFPGINSVNSTWNRNSVRKVGKSVRDRDRQISNIFNESTVRKKNLATTPLHRQSKVSASTIDSASTDNGFAISSVRKLDSTHRFPNSKSLYFRKRIGSSRRTEIQLNNSRLGSALGHNSKAELSNRRAEFSTGSERNSAKVESWTEFDHVAAIKKITSMLTHENPGAILSSSKPGHDLRDGVQSAVSFPYGSIFSNRHWNSKHSNKTRFRQPSAGQTSQNKNGQNKTVSNKILATKTNTSAQNTHLKNWPNGAIQNVDDFQHYEEYTSFADNSNLEKPVASNNTGVNHLVPIASPNLHEIVHWWKIPAFMTNASHIMESDQANDPISSVAFDPVYQNLEPNKPSRPTTLQPFKPASVYPFVSRPGYATEKIPSWLGNVKFRNKTSYKPQTQVSQNTVVQLINTDPRKPNRTMIAAKVPVTSGKPVFSGFLGSPSGPPSALGSNTYTPSLFLSQLSGPSYTTPKPGPNVHIGFTSYEETNKTSDHRAPQAPLVTYDQSCPTILINSYTRINNTIQSKEGCNDLNIIINSHVFNTNTLKSTPSPVDDQITNHETYQTYGEADKYVGQIDTGPSYHQPAPAYHYYTPQNDPGNIVPQGNDVSSDGNSVQVFQGAQINILGSNAQNAVTSFVDATSPAEFEVEEFDESDSPDDNPNTESLESSSGLAESESGQADDAPGLNSVVQPAGAGLSNPSSVSNSPSSSTGQTALSPSPSSSPASASDDDDDDDDDDDFDLSPIGIMESIGALFNYFTFVNPLHYGFFSLAAAPFTALAAGILGIFSFLFPWMFPSGFSFNRAGRNYAVNFWPNVEEIVWPSIDNHGRMNEWKRRRKKRKR
ncbi:uncharacterized protein LOC128885811 isoform X2 [Hylaeus anthracinus]|uniref:uncharacterized protein LOC128885811 isoform X2 n=1 Tax=Hylaeus anthracinus TaxID=313031 RepID=UPI0023BA3943|nr:uncharacterized protein LOC128885811 isoform X2 [Hylaeus anthracinus]